MNKLRDLLNKSLVVGVIVCFILVSPSTLAITKDYINHPPEAPNIEGSRPRNNQLPIGFSLTGYWNITTTDPDKNDIYLQIDWSDGSFDDWFGPYHSDEKVSVNHTYSKMGTFTIRARAKDTYGAVGPWGTEDIPIGDNNPPEAPTIDGPSDAKPEVEYCFTFHSTDPDDDEVKYIIDWGDDSTYEETEYQSSCTPIEACHTWYEKGYYTISCKAIDIFGAESIWSTYSFWVDGSKISNRFIFQLLFESFPFLEVLLRRMNLLR